MLMRTAAADPVLDEMRWKSYMALSNEIIVIPSEKMNREISSDIPITILEVENFLISNNYYESKDVLNFYNQTILYVNQYKSGLRNVKGALEEIAKGEFLKFAAHCSAWSVDFNGAITQDAWVVNPKDSELQSHVSY